MTEIRYVKPYFSSLRMILNAITVGVQVQNQQGQQGIMRQPQKPALQVNITGWIAGQVARSDTFEFLAEPNDKPSMQDVLAKAQSLGVNVVDSWLLAFDKIADYFPVTAQQSDDAVGIGPSVYLRPDMFEAQLHPDRPKSIVIVVGIYSDAEYQKVQSYVDLVFEDGATKRRREEEIASRENALAAEQSVLDGSHPNLANLNAEQIADAKKNAAQNVNYLTQQLAELRGKVTGKLADLVGGVETELQQTVQASVGALCTAILMQLKASEPDYAGIDVARVMADFAIPDVT